ncbi:MAG TPA: PEP-CTERM sorting domain-containing protein [Phycisphaerae bacterium]|nr:PEP-CTERM sorting domain-containing protein [Phycisphaerae bacterium]HRW55321.1 PEP-CTERM sorting domain-containing protein [Phycisphaerae bacterium]
MPDLTDTDWATGTGILGGRRLATAFVNFTSGSIRNTANLNGADSLIWTAFGANEGLVSVQWPDLVDADLTDNHTLGGFELDVTYNMGEIDLLISVTDVEDNSANAELTIPAPWMGFKTYFIPFSAFSGIDMTHVRQALLGTNGFIGPNEQIHFGELRAVAPEPSACALFGLAAVALARRRRRDGVR